MGGDGISSHADDTANPCPARCERLGRAARARACPSRLLAMSASFRFLCLAGAADATCPAGPNGKACAGNGACVNATCQCEGRFLAPDCVKQGCLRGCSGNGECNTDTGICACAKGYMGEDCSKDGESCCHERLPWLTRLIIRTTGRRANVCMPLRYPCRRLRSPALPALGIGRRVRLSRRLRCCHRQVPMPRAVGRPRLHAAPVRCALR